MIFCTLTRTQLCFRDCDIERIDGKIELLRARFALILKSQSLAQLSENAITFRSVLRESNVHIGKIR